MSELVVTLLRLSYLVLLWFFVLAAIAVLRRDIFGTRLTRRNPRRTPASAPARPEPRPEPRRPAPQRGVPSRLVVTHGPLSGTTIPLGPSAVLVGRSPACTLVLDDDYSSTRHARFFPEGGQWWVEDLGSTNGTFLREEPVTAPARVPVGAPVRVGQTVIELQR
ncbi:FHA domain-containing protein FhaB/FipA [Georgenia wangjunii]|uniref:FHA domain-containing protein FhaB/FipA n=1 Tax=Georgenia wangjunii TaxID=3117730 RepID=UPI002F25EB8A